MKSPGLALAVLAFLFSTSCSDVFSTGTPLTESQKDEVKEFAAGVGALFAAVRLQSSRAWGFGFLAESGDPRGQAVAKLADALEAGGCDVDYESDSMFVEAGVRGAGCPVVLALSARRDIDGNRMTGTLEAQYQSSDSAFVKLYGLSGFRFTGQGEIDLKSPRRGAAEGSGTFETEKYGRVSLAVESSGSRDEGYESAVRIRFPEFTALWAEKIAYDSDGNPFFSCRLNGEPVDCEEDYEDGLLVGLMGGLSHCPGHGLPFCL